MLRGMVNRSVWAWSVSMDLSVLEAKEQRRNSADLSNSIVCTLHKLQQ